MRAQFPEKLEFLFNPHRYKIAWGGRGGTKSWGFARALEIIGAHPEILWPGRKNGPRILCARETQKSITHSVHHLLESQIPLLGLSNFYQVQKATIIGANGAQFIFAGLKHNIDNIKSLEACDIVWVEEAQSVSKESWQKLIPTIRKGGSEIWVSFNAELATDDTYRRFVLAPPPNACVVKVGWQDNPWFPDVLREEMEFMRSNDPDAYEHIYGGSTRSAVEGAIYKAEILRAEKENRICRVPYDPTRPVDTFWDLGYADRVSIWFAQALPFEFRVIDYYENDHQALDHYLRVIQQKEYILGQCVFPWDGGAKSLGTGRSIEELTRAKGFRARVLPQLSVADGINAVRTIFPQLWFDGEKCADGLQYLRRYQFGPAAANGVERREPLHDDASHPADALRTLAVAIKTPDRKKTGDRRKAPAARVSAWS